MAFSLETDASMLLMENEFAESDCLAFLAAEDQSFLEIEGVYDVTHNILNLTWLSEKSENLSLQRSDNFTRYINLYSMQIRHVL